MVEGKGKNNFAQASNRVINGSLSLLQKKKSDLEFIHDDTMYIFGSCSFSIVLQCTFRQKYVLPSQDAFLCACAITTKKASSQDNEQISRPCFLMRAV